MESVILNREINVPWSEPVLVKDPFEREFTGIFNRYNFSQYFVSNHDNIDVVSLWSEDSIPMVLSVRNRRNCLGSSRYNSYVAGGCDVANGIQTIAKLYIKLGDEMFELEGENGIFAVNQKLATALKKSPSENVKIRLITTGGATVDSQIGEVTVKNWKMIY